MHRHRSWLWLVLTLQMQHKGRAAPEASSLCFLFLAISLVRRSLSSLPVQHLKTMKGRPSPPSPCGIFLQHCHFLLTSLFLSGAPIPPLVIFVMPRCQQSRQRSEADEVYANDSTEFDAITSNSGVDQMKWDVGCLKTHCVGHKQGQCVQVWCLHVAVILTSKELKKQMIQVYLTKCCSGGEGCKNAEN